MKRILLIPVRSSWNLSSTEPPDGITLHCILHRITLHCTTSPYIALHYIALHCIALHCISLHCMSLHYITLHYIALHYLSLHYIAPVRRNHAPVQRKHYLYNNRAKLLVSTVFSEHATKRKQYLDKTLDKLGHLDT